MKDIRLTTTLEKRSLTAGDGMEKRWSVSSSLIDGHSGNYSNQQSFTVSAKQNAGMGIQRITRNRFESNNML